MPITSYIALRLTEIEKDGEKDSQIIILYNENEEKYYIYGTRRPLKITEKNIIYEYVYDYSRLKSLLSLIMILTGQLNIENIDDNKYSVEIHNINICDCELDKLNYHYLNEKFSKHNEMVAYDNQPLDKKKLKKILKTLSSSWD
jgi:hypothetical protein